MKIKFFLIIFSLFILLFIFRFPVLAGIGTRCVSCPQCNCADSCGAACGCSSWSNQGCGKNGCSSTKMSQKRSCYATGDCKVGVCRTEYQCVSSSACVTPTPACSYTGDCGHKCAASGCNACACDGDYRDPKYTWSSLGCSSDCKTCYCGKLKATPTPTKKPTPTPTPKPTATPTPVPSCTMSLSPLSLSIKTGESALLTANVNLVNATVKQVNFTSADSNIAQVDPSTAYPPAPYRTYVIGQKVGLTTISVQTLLNPSGSCTAPSPTTVTVEAAAWFQTQGGDVYSGGELRSNIPATADDPNLSLKLDNWSGIITHQDENGVILGNGYPSNDTPDHWLAESEYQGKPYGSFQFFKKKFAMELQAVDYPVETGTITNAPANGVYYAQGDKNLDGDWDLTGESGRWLVLLVENGNVNIQRNIKIPAGNFVAIVTEGNLTFADDVGQAHGMFIADGVISTGTGTEEFKGEGVFAAESFSLGRDFGNATNETTPIETFKARPDLIMSSYKDATYNVWWFFQKWQEVAP